VVIIKRERRTMNRNRCAGIFLKATALVWGVVVLSATRALAVDPDMQALVIDNGSGCPSGYSSVGIGQPCMQIPEPSMLALFAVGLGTIALVVYRCRRR
jgi:hypothetical protein